VSKERIGVEDWARVAARLLKRTREERQAIFDELAIDPQDWRAWDAHYMGVIDAEYDNGTLVVAKLYAARCGEEMQRRAAAAARPKTQPLRAMDEPASLPFRADAEAAPPPRVTFAAGHPAHGNTADPIAAREPSLPFSSRDLPLTSIDVYAYLSAAGERGVEEARNAWAKYGRDDAARAAVDQAWAERFAADEALAAEFRVRRDELRRKLRQRG
jgi:hypothetical protein